MQKLRETNVEKVRKVYRDKTTEKIKTIEEAYQKFYTCVNTEKKDWKICFESMKGRIDEATSNIQNVKIE